MRIVNIAEAKARLSELITLAEQGHEVVIARRGLPVARLCAETQTRRPLDIEAMRAAIHDQTMSQDDSMALVRQMRDARY
jgi:antitoxin (DNA-binding transcriptional repressor) of toxin-antitoxin stability system